MASLPPPAPTSADALQPKKKRRTLRDAEQELHESRKALAEARRKLVLTAGENAKMKVMLMKYIERDDSLLSSSQLSQGASQQTPTQRSVVDVRTGPTIVGIDSAHSPREITSAEEGGCESEDSMWADDMQGDDGGQGLSQMSQLSQLSHWSEFSSTSNLDEIINFLEKQDVTETERLSTLEAEYLELKATKACVRVGVGVLLTSPEHPHCVLVGKRKGSHGAGRLALPGGHLEMYESWEECGSREVKEETDIDMKDLRFAYVTNDPMEEEDKHYITIFLHAVVPSGQVPRNMEPNKCEGWIWEPWQQLRAATNLFVPLRHLTHSDFVLPSS
ncbi:TPA: hypothetical protein N0F65_012387 [Lagenidium giganteum]|uniref:Nudix hydrolase domain-containing protein n=1 Tax=Lagenidium giganteum TaxID=4803 RepID=A0AAV2YNI0_9STRA|nr:TPA: hypothetical protein N0F65_012387 [Lagenidium giganteum]